MGPFFFWSRLVTLVSFDGTQQKYRGIEISSSIGMMIYNTREQLVPNVGDNVWSDVM